MLTLQPSLPSGMAQRERCTAVRPGLPSPALVQVRRLTRRALRSRKNSLCTCKLIALGAPGFESVWLSMLAPANKFRRYCLQRMPALWYAPDTQQEAQAPPSFELKTMARKIRAKEPASLTVHGVEEAMEKALRVQGNWHMQDYLRVFRGTTWKTSPCQSLPQSTWCHWTACRRIVSVLFYRIGLVYKTVLEKSR